jgi:ABC-type multidrug transport system ATPase subunit/ABC-type uncharacterized transport system permease subunit
MDILLIGLRDGLIWFPFVFGIGLLFSHLRRIDVSIDGIAILSGIIAAVLWQASNSYLISVVGAILGGAGLAVAVSLLMGIFSVHPIMAGVVFSLAAHSFSILWIGESLVIADTALIPGLTQIPWWLPGLTALVALSGAWFYATRFGIATRRLGDGVNINTGFHPVLLQCAAYGVSGAFYGLAAALYTHGNGHAKSGGSFEILVVALCAYLSIDRIVEISRKSLGHLRNTEQGEVVVATGWRGALLNFWGSIAFKALIGALFFQLLAFLVIAKTPNPVYWKIIFSAILLASLLHWPPRKKARLEVPPTAKKETAPDPYNLTASEINMHYEVGTERRRVFRHCNAQFKRGINVLHGPNGSGKSTLLGIIGGIITPDSGRVVYLGRDISGQAAHQRPVFMLHQNPFQTLAPTLTVAENLVAGMPPSHPLARQDPATAIERLQNILKSHNVTLLAPPSASFWHKPVRSLSGGQATCVAFYCGLLSDKPILLADEPTTGLDKDNFAILVKLMTALARERCLIVTSHDARLREIADADFFIENFQLTANHNKENKI